MVEVPRSRYLVFFSLAIGGCLLDLATKSWIFSRLGLPGHDVEWLIPHYLGFQTSLNYGALFGIGQGFGFIFVSLSLVALTGILYWLFWIKAASDWTLTVALGGIAAGICGNGYDRLGLHGLTHQGERILAVRDWVLIQLSPEWTWPNFNIADSLLVGGAMLLVWHAFTTPAPQASRAAA